MMEKNAKIYVAGHRGMVGSAILRELKRQGYTNFVLRTHKELDLMNQALWRSSLRKKSPNTSSWLRRRSAALWLTNPRWLILCTIT